MRCNNCNKEFQDGMNFCPHCGEPAIPVAQVDDNATSPIGGNTQYAEQTQSMQNQQQPYPQQPYQQQQSYQQQQPYQQPQQAYQTKSNGGGNAKWIVIGLLGGLLIGVAGFLVWMFLIKDKPKDEPAATTAAVEQTSGKEEAAQDNSQQPAEPQVQHDTVVVERVVEKPVVVETQAPAPPKNRRAYASASGSGRWPFTSTRYLDPSELYGMSAWDKKIMRNEIYARHGYVFQTRDMINYFNSQPWYTPISRNVRLSKIEQYNVQLIKSFE